MKPKLLTIMLLLSVVSFSQSGVKTFTSLDSDISYEEFKKEYKTSQSKENNPSGSITITIEGDSIDSDYKKVTYVFIGNSLMNCVVEFKEKQNVESLIAKYGEGNEEMYGYEWKYDKVNIIFNDNRPYEVMVLFSPSSNFFVGNGKK